VVGFVGGRNVKAPNNFHYRILFHSLSVLAGSLFSPPPDRLSPGDFEETVYCYFRIPDKGF
jgi:hypothetical protein